MKDKPTTLSILQNDTWAAPAVGVFLMILVMTGIVSLFSTRTSGATKIEANPASFAWMSLAAFILAVGISVWRIRFVKRVFDNGVVIKALVIGMSVYRSNLKLNLRYTYLGQEHEVKVDQVITGKTKKLLQRREVVLVIDQTETKHILIREVYL